MWTFTWISREVFHVKSHEKFMWSSLHTNFTWVLCEFQMKLVKFTWSFIHVNLTWGTIGCVGREYNFYIWTCRHVLSILDLGVRERASTSIKSNNVYLNTFKRNIKRINTFCTRVVHVLWRRQGMLYDVYEFVLQPEIIRWNYIFEQSFILISEKKFQAFMVSGTED